MKVTEPASWTVPWPSRVKVNVTCSPPVLETGWITSMYIGRPTYGPNGVLPAEPSKPRRTDPMNADSVPVDWSTPPMTTSAVSVMVSASPPRSGIAGGGDGGGDATTEGGIDESLQTTGERALPACAPEMKVMEPPSGTLPRPSRIKVNVTCSPPVLETGWITSMNIGRPTYGPNGGASVPLVYPRNSEPMCAMNTPVD